MIAEILSPLMFAAMCGAILLGYPVVFTLTGVALVFALIGYFFGIFQPTLLHALPSRIWGTMTSQVLIAIPLFVFMGIMLEKSKIAEELLEAMGRLFGRVRGGLAISVSVVGMLLAASTGIVGATVVTMGLMALPTMMRRGYSPALAAGSICAAGTLGQIIPPSTVLVIMGEVLSAAYQTAQFEQGKFAVETLSVGELFAGALFPGLMLVGLYIGYQFLVALLRPAAAPAMPRDEGEPVPLGSVLRAVVPPLILIVAVLGSILGGIATPTEAASVGAVGALLLAGARLHPGRSWAIYAAGLALAAMVVVGENFDLRATREVIPPGDQVAIAVAAALCAIAALGIGSALWRVAREGVLIGVMRTTLIITAMIFAMLIGATLFSLVFRGLGGDHLVEAFFADLPGGKFAAILVVMAAMFVMGFFLDFVEITIIVVPIVGPILLQMDIDPVWLGVLIAINLQTSFLTPPFGFSLFYLRGVAPREVRTTHIYKGVIPFVLLQILAMGLLALFPALATWLPSVIF